MRAGVSVGRRTVVIHAGRLASPDARVGLAVSKAVGGAVVRNTVKRRLRAILAGLLPSVPPGTGVVARALPAAASVSYAELERDVAAALAAALAKVGR